eukprot:jgi/Bigna1/129901/aug1.10_g4609
MDCSNDDIEYEIRRDARALLIQEIKDFKRFAGHNNKLPAYMEKLIGIALMKEIRIHITRVDAAAQQELKEEMEAINVQCRLDDETHHANLQNGITEDEESKASASNNSGDCVSTHQSESYDFELASSISSNDAEKRDFASAMEKESVHLSDLREEKEDEDSPQKMPCTLTSSSTANDKTPVQGSTKRARYHLRNRES